MFDYIFEEISETGAFYQLDDYKSWPGISRLIMECDVEILTKIKDFELN